MIQDNRYLGEIFHYGVKGMKWGVLRSPEQLGHVTGGKQGVEKSDQSGTIEEASYRSPKGFVVDRSKITEFCLKAGAKHSDQFFHLGYKEEDSARLLHDIEEGYDSNLKTLLETYSSGVSKYSIPMELGVTHKRWFRTVWTDDGPDGTDRLITAYIDRRLKRKD